jgi:phosphate transport system substrate-binding protein
MEGFRDRFVEGSISCLLVLLAVMGFLAVSGCSGRDDASQGTAQPGVQGTVRVSGAWALYPMMVRWAEEYRKIHPGVRIDVSAGGAGKGVADSLAGLTDVGMVSRDIKKEETDQGAVFVPVVKDAVFPVMNEENPVAEQVLRKRGVKRQVFIDLWVGGKTMTWGGIAGMGAPEHVQVYTRSDSCGAAETWANYLSGKRQEDLKGIGVYGDPGLADAVKKDRLGIGYNNLNYAYDMKTGLPIKGLQVVSIDVNENGRLDPGEILDTKEKAINAVASGVYPSPPARDLYLLTKGKFKGPSKEFVTWILTDGQRYVGEAGYIKLSDGQIKTALEKLNQ